MKTLTPKSHDVCPRALMHALHDRVLQASVPPASPEAKLTERLHSAMVPQGSLWDPFGRLFAPASPVVHSAGWEPARRDCAGRPYKHLWPQGFWAAVLQLFYCTIMPGTVCEVARCKPRTVTQLAALENANFVMLTCPHPGTPACAPPPPPSTSLPRVWYISFKDTSTA